MNQRKGITLTFLINQRFIQGGMYGKKTTLTDCGRILFGSENLLTSRLRRDWVYVWLKNTTANKSQP